MRSKIEAIVELYLIFPYHLAYPKVIELVHTWSFKLYSIGSNESKAVIGIPVKNFKKIFGSNPKIGEYKVPVKIEKFVSKIVVKEIKINESD